MAKNPIATTSQPIHLRIKCRRAFPAGRPISQSDAAVSTKQMAAFGAMRPGCDVATVLVSRQRSSSMPGFQPVAYSTSVSSAIPPAPSTQSRAACRARSPGICKRNIAPPLRMNASAVFGFIVTVPGSRFVSE